MQLKSKMALKRALPQVVMQILMELGSIDESTVNKLNKFKARIVKTYGGVPAGKIQAVKLFFRTCTHLI